jgi:hypothetical protein
VSIARRLQNQHDFMVELFGSLLAWTVSFRASAKKFSKDFIFLFLDYTPARRIHVTHLLK